MIRIILIYILSLISCRELSTNKNQRGHQHGTVKNKDLFTIAEKSSYANLISIGKMVLPRAVHTATVLKNGKVLICGGFAGGTYHASAEIYDPSSNSFSVTGTMLQPRAGHTATLLPSGNVLIAGGFNGSYLSSVEIFNPVKGTFVISNEMTTARSGHTATILPGGKILFAGGVGKDWTFLKSAELYDISTGKFSSTGDMNLARESHTATLLKNGMVLIAGGHSGRRANIKIYDAAELYDPAREKFMSTGSMNKIRHKHDAVLLTDSRVLISGGSDERDGEGAYNDTEIYDPVSGYFSLGATMNLSRYKHNGTSILLGNGDVLIAGGASQAELYDYRKKKFSLTGKPMRTRRLFSTATLLTGTTILITGGYNEIQEVSSEAWLYTSSKN